MLFLTDSAMYGPGETPLLMSESFCLEDKSPSQSLSPSALPRDTSAMDSQTTEATNPDVESIYNQALLFINLTEKLKKAPERLQGQYQHLEGLETELNDSIEDLKQKSQVMNRRLSPEK